jgi:hypothetical protein
MHDEVKVLHCCKNKKTFHSVDEKYHYFLRQCTYLSVRFIYTNIDLINTWPVVFVLDVGNTTQYNPSMKNTYAQKSIIQLHVKRRRKGYPKILTWYKSFTI